MPLAMSSRITVSDEPPAARVISASPPIITSFGKHEDKNILFITNIVAGSCVHVLVVVECENARSVELWKRIRNIHVLRNYPTRK